MEYAGAVVPAGTNVPVVAALGSSPSGWGA